MNRRLTLHRETLTELTQGELGEVVGGTSDHCVTYSLLLTGCMCSGMYPSLNIDCTLTPRCRD